MKRAYNHRPQDFRRRIIAIVETSRQDLLIEEQRWLSMIKEGEVGKRYYNLKTTAGHWHADPDKLKTIGEKIAASHIKRKEDGRYARGWKMSDESKQKLSEKLKGRESYERTEETRKKISENSRRLQSEGRIGMTGKKHRTDTLELMSEKQAGENNPMHGKTHTVEARAKISEAGLGRVVTEETRYKISKKNKGRKISEASLAALNSPDSIARRTEKLRGQKRTPEQIERIKAGQRRARENRQ